MTPAQIRELALTLYTMIIESDERTAQAIRQGCIRICQDRGVEPPTAALSSDALTGYLYGWRYQTLSLVTPIMKA